MMDKAEKLLLSKLFEAVNIDLASHKTVIDLLAANPVAARAEMVNNHELTAGRIPQDLNRKLCDWPNWCQQSKLPRRHARDAPAPGWAVIRA